MEKKHSNKDKTASCQLELFQSLNKNESIISNNCSIDFQSSATIIQMGSYKTKQQVEKFYEVVKNLTAHLD